MPVVTAPDKQTDSLVTVTVPTPQPVKPPKSKKDEQVQPLPLQQYRGNEVSQVPPQYATIIPHSGVGLMNVQPKIQGGQRQYGRKTMQRDHHSPVDFFVGAKLRYSRKPHIIPDHGWLDPKGVFHQIDKEQDHYTWAKGMGWDTTDMENKGWLRIIPESDSESILTSSSPVKTGPNSKQRETLMDMALRGRYDTLQHEYNTEDPRYKVLWTSRDRLSRKGSKIRHARTRNSIRAWLAPSGEIHELDWVPTHEDWMLVMGTKDIINSAEKWYGDNPEAESGNGIATNLAQEKGWHRIVSSGDGVIYTENEYALPNSRQRNALKDLAVSERADKVIHTGLLGKETIIHRNKENYSRLRYARPMTGLHPKIQTAVKKHTNNMVNEQEGVGETSHEDMSNRLKTLPTQIVSYVMTTQPRVYSSRTTPSVNGVAHPGPITKVTRARGFFNANYKNVIYNNLVKMGMSPKRAAKVSEPIQPLPQASLEYFHVNKHTPTHEEYFDSKGRKLDYETEVKPFMPPERPKLTLEEGMDDETLRRIAAQQSGFRTIKPENIHAIRLGGKLLLKSDFLRTNKGSKPMPSAKQILGAPPIPQGSKRATQEDLRNLEAGGNISSPVGEPYGTTGAQNIHGQNLPEGVHKGWPEGTRDWATTPTEPRPSAESMATHPMLIGTKLGYHLAELKQQVPELSKVVDEALRGPGGDGHWTNPLKTSPFRTIGNRLSTMIQHAVDSGADKSRINGLRNWKNAYRWEHVDTGMHTDHLVHDGLKSMLNGDDKNVFSRFLQQFVPGIRQTKDENGKQIFHVKKNFVDMMDDRQRAIWERLRNNVMSAGLGGRGVNARTADELIVRSLFRNAIRDRNLTKGYPSNIGQPPMHEGRQDVRGTNVERFRRHSVASLWRGGIKRSGMKGVKTPKIKTPTLKVKKFSHTEDPNVDLSNSPNHATQYGGRSAPQGAQRAPAGGIVVREGKKGKGYYHGGLFYSGGRIIPKVNNG